MNVLVVLDTVSATNSKPTVDAILQRTWASGTIFYLFSVLETGADSLASVEASSKPVKLEKRVRLLYDTMLSLETVRPEGTYLCQVAAGEAVENIVYRAKELDADLIIIGASDAGSSSGARECLDARVSRRANCPVESIGWVSSAESSFSDRSITR